MIAFLIGAGVGLVAGAGIGFLLAALFKGGYIAELEQQVDELGERCDRYVGELDALVEATRPAPADHTPDLSDVLSGRIEQPGFDADESWAEMGWRAAAEPPRRNFDANPTVLLKPGQTYEQWYEAYATDLDSWSPGWWDDLPQSAAPALLALAVERRIETYEQNELDHDRIPTREGFEERPWRPNRPGIAQYPKESK